MQKSTESTDATSSLMRSIGAAAREASHALALAPRAVKDKALKAAAEAIRRETPAILAAALAAPSQPEPATSAVTSPSLPAAVTAAH